MRVHGVGPRPCRVMFVGEAPGQEEDLSGIPFVGKAGGELNRHLNGYTLPAREDVFITNLVKERPPRNSDPTAEIIARDEPELWTELEEVQPEVIVTLGRISTRYFLGDLDMEMAHGIPMPAHGDAGYLDLTTVRPTIFPCYHPAAGLHAPELAALFVYDMQRLSLFLKGALPPAATDVWLGKERYTLGFAQGTDLFEIVAIDTEGLPYRPWGLSASDSAGEAWVVRAGDREGLARFRSALCSPLG